jgi:hypothetical protein
MALNHVPISLTGVFIFLGVLTACSPGHIDGKVDNSRVPIKSAVFVSSPSEYLNEDDMVRIVLSDNPNFCEEASAFLDTYVPSANVDDIVPYTVGMDEVWAEHTPGTMWFVDLFIRIDALSDASVGIEILGARWDEGLLQHAQFGGTITHYLDHYPEDDPEMSVNTNDVVNQYYTDAGTLSIERYTPATGIASVN